MANKLRTSSAKHQAIKRRYSMIYDTVVDQTQQQEMDEAWRKHNMEYDLRTTDWIIEKVCASEVYAQNLYAAMCNNDFEPLNVEDTPEVIYQVLKDGPPRWSCSWRHAGGVIADMREEGDYLNWYCSGIRDGEPSEDQWGKMSDAERQRYLDVYKHYVSESTVTEEIREDLLRLGWRVHTYSE